MIGSSYSLFVFQHNPQAPGNVKPESSSFLPGTGSTVWRRQAFTLTFNEPILPETLSVSCTPSITGWKLSLLNTTNYRLTHDPFPSDTAISCTILDVQDPFGFSPDTQFSWSFTSNANYGSDVYLPSVSH
jgi:hypothetical protein